jgi:hypothetical protein
MTVDRAALTALFTAGPNGFIADRFREFLALTQPDAVAPDDVDAAADAADDDDGDDDDDDDDDEAPEGDAAATPSDNWEEEAAARVAGLWSGGPDDVAAVWGAAPPAALQQLFALVRKANPYTTLTEMRFDVGMLPADHDENLFELCVLNDQLNDLGTALAEAFSGAICFAGYGDGDSWHVDVYDVDGKGREIARYAHDDHNFAFEPVATSLDDVVFLAAVIKAAREEWIDADAAKAALAPLHGRVRPSWHFSIGDVDDGFVPFKSEYPVAAARLAVRASWIRKVLGGDHVSGLEETPRLFHAGLNPIIKPEQVEPRIEAAKKFAYTALYAMWRAYLFDEPELERYLDVGRAHPGRLARDGAKLIDELRAGRTTLGKIKDWPARLARFRGLDLDPRRAEAREAEKQAAAERAAAERARLVEVLGGVDDDGLAAFIFAHGGAGLWAELLPRVQAVLPARGARALDGIVAAVHNHDGSSYSEEEHELIDELAATTLPALQAFAWALAEHGSGQARPTAHVGHQLLRRWATRGVLVAEVGAQLWRTLADEPLEQAKRHDTKRWLEVLALQAWPSLTSTATATLSTLLAQLPVDESFDISLRFDGLNGAVAAATRRVLAGADDAVRAPFRPLLLRLAQNRVLRLRHTRVEGAQALAAIDPTCGGDADAVVAVVDALLFHVGKINDGEEAADAYRALAQFARGADAERRARLGVRVHEQQPYADSKLETKAGRAVALAAFGVGSAADVDDALTALAVTKAWKPEYTLRQHRLARAIADETPGLTLSAPALAALAGSDDDDVAAWAQAALERKEPACARGADRAARRRLTWVDVQDAAGPALRAWIANETLLGRQHVARALVPAPPAPERDSDDDDDDNDDNDDNDGSANVVVSVDDEAAVRAALEAAAAAVAARTTTEMSHDDDRLLTECVRALFRLAPAPSTIAQCNTLLLHNNRDVKDPVLRAPPADVALAPGMRQVLAENWGWQESTAREWLTARGLLPDVPDVQNDGSAG